MVAKLVAWVKQYGQEALAVVCVICIALVSYNLGRIQRGSDDPITLHQDAAILAALASRSSVQVDDKTVVIKAASGTPISVKPTPTPYSGRVVTSKGSTTKNFYYPECAAAKRIKPENQIWFNTPAAALAAGYHLGSSCKAP